MHSVGGLCALRRVQIDFDAIGNIEAHLSSEKDMEVARFHAVLDGASDKPHRILGPIEGIGFPVAVCRPAVSHDDCFRPDFWPHCMGSAFRCASSATRVLRLRPLLASLAISDLSRLRSRIMLPLIADVLLTFAKKLGHLGTPPISPMEEMPRSQ